MNVRWLVSVPGQRINTKAAFYDAGALVIHRVDIAAR